MKTHAAQFRSASVHFLLTTSLTGSTDLWGFARKLLDSDLAYSAAWPSETAIRVAYRHRKQARNLRRARSLSVTHDHAVKDGSWRSAFSFQRKHPHLGSKFVHAKWLNERIRPRLERFLETKSVKDLASLAVWHPVFTVAHVFPNTHINWSRKADASPPLRGEETTGDIAADSPVTETRETGHAHKGEVGTSASEETNNSDEHLKPDALDGESLLEILADAERQYLDRQVVSAAIRTQDARLFGGEDWDEDGF
ncbi:MAG: hypothetical protein ACTJHU_04320, partial [Mycetocola sp.]